MGWDAVAAAGSVVGAVVLLAGTLAAVVQLKHLRLTYQIESYLAIMADINTPEMVEARQFVESQDFSDPHVLAAAFEKGLDHRILRLGGFLQTVARLINQGILDKQLFAPVIFACVPMWRALRPVAEEIRKRTNYPRWLDVEVLVYNVETIVTKRRMMRGYPAALMERTHFAEFIDHYRAEAATVISDAPKP